MAYLVFDEKKEGPESTVPIFLIGNILYLFCSDYFVLKHSSRFCIFPSLKRGKCEVGTSSVP